MTQARRFALLVVVAASLCATALAQTAFTNRVVSLRAGPGRDYPLVTHVGTGEPVNVAGCIDDWTWCDVVAGGDRGWVYSGGLSYPYEGRRVLFLGHGASFGLPVETYDTGTYWDTYYRGRPWYGRRTYWVGHPWVHGPLGVRPGIAVVRPGVRGVEHERRVEHRERERRIEHREHERREVRSSERAHSEERHGSAHQTESRPARQQQARPSGGHKERPH